MTAPLQLRSPALQRVCRYELIAIVNRERVQGDLISISMPLLLPLLPPQWSITSAKARLDTLLHGRAPRGNADADLQQEWAGSGPGWEPRSPPRTGETIAYKDALAALAAVRGGGIEGLRKIGYDLGWETEGAEPGRTLWRGVLPRPPSAELDATDVRLLVRAMAAWKLWARNWRFGAEAPAAGAAVAATAPYIAC